MSDNKNVYSYNEVLKAATQYFRGDELAATTWIKKYCLHNEKGELLEKTPEDMHNRIINEILRIEDYYGNGNLTKEKLQEYFYNFQYLVPGGSSMSGIGDSYKHTSLSNCFVIGNQADSYGGIMELDQELIQLSKRRGGVGIDLSHLRPASALVTNDARTSSGAVSFMTRFSNSSKEVAQNGRRGALMLSISIEHPDAEGFIDAKLEQGQVTGANISVKVSNSFMEAVEKEELFVQKFPIDAKLVLQDLSQYEVGKLYNCTEPNTYFRVIDAKKLWEKIIHNAWAMAEPGVLFWNTIKSESPADLYEGFETISTNPCLHPDTLIRMSDGSEKKIIDVKPGDKVLSYNLETEQPEETVVVWSGKTKENAELYSNGLVKVTKEHLIYSPKQHSYVEASNATDCLLDNYLVKETSFEPIEEKSDVYDIQLNNIHNFFANGVLVHNCGEIPLCPYDSCRLLSINLYNLVDNKFTKEACINYNKLEEVSKAALVVMDDIMDLEIEHVKDIIEKVSSDPEDDEIINTELKLWNKILSKTVKGRRTGIGVTAVGDMLAALNLQYGSGEGNSVLLNVMKEISKSIYTKSIELAKTRGSFPAYNKDEYNTAQKYDVGKFLRRMLESLPEEIIKMYSNYGRRNISCLTCAPSGTVSLMTQTTSGIEPLFMPSYIRRRKVDDKTNATFIDKEGIGFEEFRVVHPKLIDWYKTKYNLEYGEAKTTLESLTNDEFTDEFKTSPWYNATAQTIDPVTKVQLQAGVQKWIDHSISCTVNLDKDTKEEVVDKLYKEAFKTGCKGLTVYRDGCRDGILVSDNKKEAINTVSYINEPRPEELPAQVYRFKNDKENWIAFIGFRDNKPYEIFTGKIDGEVKWLPKTVKDGTIKQVTNSDGSHRYDFLYKIDFNYVNVFPAISQQFNREYWNYARFTSGMLRAGIPLVQVVSILRGLSAEPLLNVWKSGVARALSQFIEDGTKTGSKCPNCGGELIFEGGCSHCPNCGESKCG